VFVSLGAEFSINATLYKGIEMPTRPALAALSAKTAKVATDLGGPALACEYERKYGHVQLIEATRTALHIDQARPEEAHKVFIGRAPVILYTQPISMYF
jgi:hypothetical protein